MPRSNVVSALWAQTFFNRKSQPSLGSIFFDSNYKHRRGAKFWVKMKPGRKGDLPFRRCRVALVLLASAILPAASPGCGVGHTTRCAAHLKHAASFPLARFRNLGLRGGVGDVSDQSPRTFIDDAKDVAARLLREDPHVRNERSRE